MNTDKEFVGINTLLLFLTLTFIQFSFTQLGAVLSILMLLVINFTYRLMNREPFVKSELILLYFMIIFILYLARPPYIYELGAQIEVFWLLVGFLIVFAILISNLPVEKTIFYIILSSMLGGFLTLLSYFGDISFFYLISPPYAGTRAVGGFDGPNELATFHVLVASLCFGLIVEKDRKINIIYLILSIIISGTTIFFTFSRGGLIGLVLVSCLFLMIYLKRNPLRFLLYLLPLLGITFFAFNRYKYNIIETFINVRKNRSERGYLTDEVMRISSENPIIGKGLGSFSAVSSVKNTVPHSDFYVFLVSGGTIALLLFVFFLIYLMTKAFKIQCYSFLFFIIAFISQAMTFNHLIRGRISILFWVIISILLVKYQREKMKGDLIESQKPEFKHREQFG